MTHGPMPPGDAELVHQVREGDTAAIDALYRRHIDTLRRVCRRWTLSADDADDFAHEAFIKAILALQRTDHDVRFGVWVRVIARRVCIDHHRSAGRRANLIDRLGALWEGTDPSAEARVLAGEEGAAIGRALSTLSSRHRRVLHLREVEGLSYEQVAAALNESTTTVTPLLQRARHALRAAYRREMAELPPRPGRDATLGILAFLAPAVRWISSLRPLRDAAAAPGSTEQAVAAAAAAALLVLASPGAAPPAPEIAESPGRVVAEAPAVGIPEKPQGADSESAPVPEPDAGMAVADAGRAETPIDPPASQPPADTSADTGEDDRSTEEGRDAPTARAQGGLTVGGIEIESVVELDLSLDLTMDVPLSLVR